jgi:hypothetical protein
MRHPARKGRADSNQKAIADAIRLLGYPVMDLHAAGNGVEDLLVGLRKYDPNFARYDHSWLLVECKVPRYELTASTAVRYTQAQIEWRKQTEGWPRITVTSGQDAVNQIRALTSSPRPSAPSVPCSGAPRTMPGGQRR